MGPWYAPRGAANVRAKKSLVVIQALARYTYGVYPKDLEALARIFARFPQVQAAFLFGSRARGEAGSGSDWDFALLLDPPEPDPRLEVLSALVKAGYEPLDLLLLNEAPPALALEAAQGRLLHAREGFSLGEYVSRLAREVWDLEPLFRLQREALKRKWSP
jgi:predicted nucleotidyltransferase